jgi:dipeptidyl aminopeptidase/acylaminoacyl peptidase
MRIQNLAILGGICVLASLVSAQEEKQQAAIALKTRPTSLGKLKPGAIDKTLTVSPDGRRVAYVLKRGQKEVAVVDGVEGSEYDRIVQENVRFADTLRFSSDGSRLIYVAQRGGGVLKEFVVLDGKEGVTYRLVRDPLFSRDGKHVSYLAIGKGGFGDDPFVVLDGKEMKLPATPRLDSLRLSPDGKRTACTLQQGISFFVVADGVEGKKYGFINSLQFSPDGKRLAYEAVDQNDYLVVADGIEGKRQKEQVYLRGFSPDGKRLAYAAKRGAKWVLVLDGVEGKEYGRIEDFQFSPDGKRMAYQAERDGKWFVVVDQIEGKAYDAVQFRTILASPISLVRFSLDNKRTAYSVRRATKTFVVVDGTEGKEYDIVRIGELELAAGVGLTFSLDGKRVAYTVRREAKENPLGSMDLLVVDGAEGVAGDFISDLRFGPDGQRLACIVTRGNKKFVVVDGVEARDNGMDVLLTELFFEGPDRIRYLARNNDELFRVEVDIGTK